MSVLSQSGVLERCTSFWSLKHKGGWDLDCALLFDNVLYLVDVKSWKAEGDQGKQQDRLDDALRGLRQTASKVAEALGDCDVHIETRIVFAPTPSQSLNTELPGGGKNVSLYRDFASELAKLDSDTPSINVRDFQEAALP